MLSPLALVAAASLAFAPSAPPQKRLKLRVAVAPIDWKGYELIDGFLIPAEFRQAIDEKLTKKLMDTGRFVVLDRLAMGSLNQEKAIKEENTGQAQRGKTVPAQAMVQARLTDFQLNRRGAGLGINVGGIGRVGGDVSEAEAGVNVRILNVDTSELIGSEDASGKASATGFRFTGNGRLSFADFQAFDRSPLGQAMTKAIDKAVEKVVKRLEEQPWTARVADYDEETKDITLNAGAEAGVTVGDVFEVLRPGKEIKDPETGEVLSRRMAKIGEIKVTTVEKRISVAIVFNGGPFAAGDVVRERR